MTDIDRQARAAARAFRDEVTDAIDLDLAYERTQHGRPRNIGAIALAAVAVVAIVAGAFFLPPDGDDVEVAVDEENRASTTTVTTPQPVPDPIVLGAPDDGKESVGLPVSVEPATGLLDGQMVTVTGSGFPSDVSVGVVMCTKEAGAEHGARGVDACNIGYFAQGTTDQQGAVSVEFEVRRVLVLDGQEVDCASEPGRCIIGMGMISDYDQSGGVAVDFDPSVPLPDPPTVELAENTDLVDGEVVPAKVTGLVPNSSLYVHECSADQYRCASVGEFHADDTGTFEGGVRLWRNYGTWIEQGGGAGSANVDCAVEACVLQIQGETPGMRQIPQVPINFDSARGARVPPSIALAEPGPFSNGDTVDLLVEGLEAGTFIDLQVCTGRSVAGAWCIAYFGGEYDGSGTFSSQLMIDSQAADDPCAEGCALVTSVYLQDQGPSGIPQGPPPLFPEPVPIVITP